MTAPNSPSARQSATTRNYAQLRATARSDVRDVIARLADVPAHGQLYLWNCSEQTTETDQQQRGNR